MHLLALGFGTGCASFAPGTWGSLVGVIFYFALASLPTPWYLATVAVLFIAGVGICHRTATRLGVHDDPSIVWDEIVGYLITMTAMPEGWIWIVQGFVLFRFFDIVKPWPIRWLDRRLGGGLGIMLDDLLAAALAWLTLILVLYISHL